MKIKLYHIIALLSLILITDFLQAQVPEGFSWQDIENVDFGEGTNHFTIEAASPGSGGEVELRLDATDGPVIGRVFFHHTGSNTFFMDYDCQLNQTVSGVHDVYMNFLDYSSPTEKAELVIRNFAFNMVNPPTEPAEGNLQVYNPVPGLDPSPYYTYEVQKVSELNATNLENVTNWESPFAWYTYCQTPGDPNWGDAYYDEHGFGKWSHTYCNFELDPNTPIVVKISRLDKEGAPSGPISEAAPHPADKVDKVEIINGDVYVTMSNPAQVAIDIDGQMDSRNAPRAIANSWSSEAFPYGNEKDGTHAVTIFANPFINDKPDHDGAGVKKVYPGDPMPKDDGTWTTLYFMPGIHNMSQDADGNEREWRIEDVYKINSNRQYYIPGDAIVYGGFNDKDQTGYIGEVFENIRLFGHGTISGAKRPHWKDWPQEYTDNNVDHKILRVFEVSNARNVIVEGITSADQPEHGIYLIGLNLDSYSPNYIKWTKMIGWRVNTDGMVAYGNSYIEDCFLRLQDDAFYVTGMAIRRCVIWSDVNGAPFRGDRFMNEREGGFLNMDLPKDLVVEDIDVIYARCVFSSSRNIIGDGGNIGEKTYADGTKNTGQHLVFRNINIEDPRPQRLLITTSERDLSGVRFENVNQQYPHAWGLAPTISGTEDTPLKYWVFDNVKIAGEQVDADYLSNPAKFEANFVKDFTHRLYDTISSTDHILTRTSINGDIVLDTTAGTTEVTVTAKPIEGYYFTGWSGNLSGSNNPVTITMDSDKAITANFGIISYSISTTAENGAINLEPADGPYLPGTEVTLSAVGDLGYVLESWGGDLSGSENPTTIIMDSDKTVSANFKEIQTYTLDINPEYGTVILDPPGGEYNPGTVVTLMPEADPAYYFEQWMGDLHGFDNPATITMDEDKTVNARFVFAGFGTISSAINFGGPDYEATDGTSFSGNNSGSTYSTSTGISGTEDDELYQTERFGKDFSINILVDNGSYQVTLMFAEIFHSAVGNRLFNVSIEGEEVISNLDIYAKVGKNAVYNEIHKVTVSDGEINIDFSTVNDNAKISAIKINSEVFEGETYKLTTNANNGTIKANPAIGPYPAGSNVLLTAIPDTGFMFTGWSGDLAGSENPVTVYMIDDKNVSASFAETNWYTLSTKATNGNILVNPEEGIYGFTEGTEVSLSASPDAGYKFTGWNGDISGSDNPATLVFDSNKTVTANFVKLSSFTLSTEAMNGFISLSPEGGKYAEGTVVTLTANPNSGYRFQRWAGDVSGSENPVTIMMDADKNVRAEFQNPNALLLTINSENGSVKLTPQQDSYYMGSTVILVATPDEGYEFVGWEGDLIDEKNPVGLVMNSNKNITAVFTKITGTTDFFAEQQPGMQIYPNPFSTKTTISYKVGNPEHIRISIHNLLGQQLCVLVNEKQAAGAYQVNWDAKQTDGKPIAEGIYICRFEITSGAIHTSKVIFKR